MTFGVTDMEVKSFTAFEENAGMRIDRFIADSAPELTRSAVVRLMEEGAVTVGGKTAGKNYRMRSGDVVELVMPDPVLPEARPENIPLDIVYEDDDLLVVNKPRGMVVHPAAGNPDGTLVNALLYHCGDSLSGINGVLRPGIVHRIDKDTSGLLIVAKNDRSHKLLAEQIKEHSFTRKYQAVVVGNLRDDEGTVDAPIGRHPTDRKKMTVTAKNSREAVTHYKVLQRFGSYTHVELTLETGRTHQIRVHMAYLGHPVAGDPVYGGKKYLTSLGGQCLHAYYISFLHPTTGQTLTLSAPLPDYFTKFLDSIKKS